MEYEEKIGRNLFFSSASPEDIPFYAINNQNDGKCNKYLLVRQIMNIEDRLEKLRSELNNYK